MRRITSVRACAIFLGAFLLFQVQPIAAKAILPVFGGAPAVWTACMLFFQSLLFLGYAYAHATTRALRPRAQAALHLALVLSALCALPIALRSSGAAPTQVPALAILLLLGRSVGLPYLVLCASAPLLQAWSTLRVSERSPYRLYALSNAGSMLALLSYPIAVEPWLSTRAQELVWSAAFGAFALLSALCARDAWRATASERASNTSTQHSPDDESRAGSPTLRRRLLWLALPACASTLLLSVTNQMCQEVAVVPLLWILPLSLYLLSFILCFESDRWYSRSWCLPLLIFALVVMAQTTTMGAGVGVVYAVPVYSIGLFVCCMFCHGELAMRRPAPRHLTAFYLMIALGGALGGVFVSLAAPHLFRGFDELYVGLAACGALAATFAAAKRAPPATRRAAPRPVVVALAIVTGVIVLLVAARVATPARPGLRELRNFYGTLRVGELPAPDGNGEVRFLTHGGTRHGQQFQDARRRAWPTTYYGHPSGIGVLLDELAHGPPLRVGVVGLGAGILASYGRAGDSYRFYEINPLVIDVATREFSFLGDSAAHTEVVCGDARLSLEREEPQRFDVLVLDAFSSDAIPVHLLTLQAFALYERHLAPGGVLALHLTTRYLDLGPLVAGVARATHTQAWEIRSAADDEQGLLDARWMLLTTNAELLARPSIRSAGHTPDPGAASPRPWRDDYSNLLDVLN